MFLRKLSQRRVEAEKKMGTIEDERKNGEVARLVRDFIGPPATLSTGVYAFVRTR